MFWSKLVVLFFIDTVLYFKMSSEKLKPYQLFEDLAEKQKIVKANAKKQHLKKQEQLSNG